MAEISDNVVYRTFSKNDIFKWGVLIYHHSKIREQHIFFTSVNRIHLKLKIKKFLLNNNFGLKSQGYHYSVHKDPKVQVLKKYEKNMINKKYCTLYIQHKPEFLKFDISFLMRHLLIPFFCE